MQSGVLPVNEGNQSAVPLDLHCTMSLEEVPPSLQRLQGAATSHGPEFEWKLAGLIALRAHRRGLRFQLYTNVKVARPCDDIVLRLLGPSDRLPLPTTYFFQLKHSRPAAAENLVGVQALTSPTGHFSLRKYFEMYEGLCRLHTAPAESLDEEVERNKKDEKDKKVLKQWPLDRYRFIIYTTKDIEGRLTPATRTQPSVAEPSYNSITYRDNNNLVEESIPIPLHEDFPCEDLFSTNRGDVANIFSFNSSHTQVWNLLDEEQERKVLYHKFLRKVRNYCMQSFSDQLDHLILNEIKNLYVGNPGQFLHSYLSFLRSWSENLEKGECISEWTVHEQLEKALVYELQQKAQEMARGLIFKDEALCSLRDALRRPGPLRVVVRGASTPGRRAAKLLQVLKEDFGPNKWLYVDAPVLKNYPRDALAGAVRRVKILVADVYRQEDETFARNLAADYGNNVQVVILGGKTERNRRRCGFARNATEDNFQDEWHLAHLTDEVQERILENSIVFQGERIKLKTLESCWPDMLNEVRADLLCPLDNREEPKIGTEVPVPEEWDLNLCMELPRRLAHHSVITPDVLSEVTAKRVHLALAGFPEELLRGLAKCMTLSDVRNNNRWTVLFYEGETLSIGKETLKNIAIKKDCSSVHLLDFYSGTPFQEGNILWRESYGDKEPMMKFVKIAKGCVREPLCHHDLSFARRPHTTALLVGEAGVGKTNTMLRLAANLKEEFPAQWVVVVKIVDHRQLLSKWKNPEDLRVEHVLELLAAAAGLAGREQHSARRFFEAALRHSGAASVFIDGVDEVAPAFKRQTLRLIELLRTQMKIGRIWAAARPEVEVSLRRALCCPPLVLQPLTVEEQKQFLCEQLAAHDQQSALAVENLVAWLAQTAGGLLAVPLHLQMTAQVFGPRVASGDISFREVSLLSLYRDFVDLKREIFLEKHGLKEANLSNVPEIDNEFDVRHEKCAMFFLFCDGGYGNVLALKEFEDFVKTNPNVTKEKTGILWKNEDGSIHFIHHTFAEFFAAQWLRKNAGESEAARRFLLAMNKSERGRIQVFLEDMLGEEWPLHTAIWRRDMKAAESLLEYDGRNDSWDKEDPLFGWTVTQYVKWIYGRKEFLWRFNKAMSSRVPWLFPALEDAAKSGCPCVIREILRHAIHPPLVLPPSALRTALREAAAGGSKNHSEVVKTLFDFGASDIEVSLSSELTLPMRSAWTALHAATEVGNLEMIEVLLQHTENNMMLSVTDYEGRTPLHCALAGSHRHQVAQRLLREKGVDVNAADDRGWTPLALASAANCSKCKELLLAREADPKSMQAQRALYTAIERNNTKALKYLLEGGADPNTTNIEGTLLHQAALQGLTEAVNLLLSNGANVNAVNDKRITPLHQASFNGHTEVMQILLTNGADALAETMRGRSPIHYAAFNGHAEAIHTLIDNGASIGSIDSKGMTALHSAAMNSHTDVTLQLITMGAEVNAADDKGRTPLHLSIPNRHTETMQLLMAHGADVNKVDESKCTPLHRAVALGHENVVKLLLAQSINVNAVNDKGESVLHIAAHEGNMEVVNMLIVHDEDVNSLDNCGRSPTHRAVIKNHEYIVELLIQYGGEVFTRDSKGRSLLHEAASNGNINMMFLLLAKGVDINAVDNEGMSALHCAASNHHDYAARMLIQRCADIYTYDFNGRSIWHYSSFKDIKKKLNITPKITQHAFRRFFGEDVTQMLLELGTDVYTTDVNGRTALHYAALSGNITALRRLIEQGVDINQLDFTKTSPLHYAARSDSIETVQILLKHKADINAVDGYGKSALHIATHENSLIVASHFLAKGANVNLKDFIGRSPLHYAALKGLAGIIELLLHGGANVSDTDNFGMSPMHLASNNGNTNSIQLLLNAHASVHIADAMGRAPLHGSACNGHISSMRILLENDAEVNAQDNNGSTPLHYAASSGQTQAVQMLLDRNAVVDTKNSDGYFAIHSAASAGYKDIMKLLISKGANVNAQERNGRSPLRIAELNGHKDVVQVLLPVTDRTKKIQNGNELR